LLVHLVKNAEGKPLYYYSFLTDITERKRAEETLKESEKKYRELVKYAPIGIYEIDFRSRKLVTINDAMTLLTGYTREEMLAMDVLDLLDDKSKKDFTARISKMLQGETPDENVEYKVIAKDGHVIHAVLQVSFKVDEQGKPIGAMVVGHDITERKRVEEALQDSEKRYRRLFESAKDGILILDADTGKVDDVNPFLLTLLGYSYDELYGKYIWELGAFKDIAASKEAFQTLQDSEYIRYDDLPLETSAGQRIAVEFVSNVYLVDHHKVIQCNIRNITEQKRAEHRKGLHSRRRGEFGQER
jgi:PAS domain S-box-containing protein